MARKNRVTVPDGIYHITSRICNKAMLFKSNEVKEKIYRWIFDIAHFSGVEIYAWCIMDNHIHLLVHVPRVPERLWLDPHREPDAWAFGMRPPECRPPLWLHDGDSPRKNDVRTGDSPREDYGPSLPRPELGFMLDDEEMLHRLSSLYSQKTAEEIGERWERLRAKHRDEEVDAEKSRYCRRMYNISQFVKTLKERIAMRYNEEFKHEGCLWQGRFYSGIVENCREVLAVVAGYIDYNPVKAKLVSSQEKWGYSSWSVAQSSRKGFATCRQMYCQMFGCDWSQAKRLMLSVFNDKFPAGIDPEDVRICYDHYDEMKSATDRSGYHDENAGGTDGYCAAHGDASPHNKKSEAEEDCVCAGDSGSMGKPKYRASQAIRCGMWFFKKGGYIGRTMDFAHGVVSHLATGFPRVGFKSIKRCRAFIWVLPEVDIAA